MFYFYDHYSSVKMRRTRSSNDTVKCTLCKDVTVNLPRCETLLM